MVYILSHEEGEIKMAKRYARLNWQNAPSVTTPINATNLNKMDKGIDDCDNAIEDLYGTKISKSSIANNLVTTAEGLVLDARQGKVLQDGVDELNNNLYNKTYLEQYRILYSGDESVLDDIDKQMPNSTEYTRIVSFAIGHPVLGGTGGVLKGYRHAAGYGWQEFKSSNRNHFRQDVGGVWSAWASL